MKKRDCSHWDKSDFFQGVLLFAQTVEECTFEYSYESYKAPALNCHYLCYDIIYTAKDIDSKVLMAGNFTPLVEEFEYMLKEDFFVEEIMPDKNSILLSKNKNNTYYDISDEVLSAKIKSYPEVARYIKDMCESNNKYLSLLLDGICENIENETFDTSNRIKIYELTRMLVTELINSGYSKQYIYTVLEDTFYNLQKPIECSVDNVINFVNCFIGEINVYKVAFGVNRKAAVLFNGLRSFGVDTPTGKEKSLFNKYKKGDRVVALLVEAVDPYVAFEIALKHIEKVLSVHRINQHDSRLYISSKSYVAKQNDQDDFEDPIIINSPQNLMKKKGNTSDLHALLGDFVFFDSVEPPSSFYRAVALHNGAISIGDVSNQLLNLWTILEILISTKRDNEDRINTICNILCSVLNRSYMYSNIEQLLNDIKNCLDDSFSNDYLSKVSTNDNVEPVEKLALLLSLDKYEDLRKELLEQIKEQPILVYRIENFSKNILCNSKSIYEYIKRHERRLRWHIMRIYRNRNMIVHNGSYLPYINIITENLHFYVDELLDVLIEYYHIGIVNNESIYRDICYEESSYYRKLGVQVTSTKAKQDVKLLTEDNALELIFNNYSGNKVRKSIEKALKTGNDSKNKKTD